MESMKSLNGIDMSENVDNMFESISLYFWKYF